MGLKQAARKGDGTIDAEGGGPITEGSATVWIGDAPLIMPVSIPSIPMPKMPSVKLPSQFELKNAAPVIKSAGRYAVLDEPDTIHQTPTYYPPDSAPVQEIVPQSATVDETVEKTEEVAPNCPVIENVSYNYRLSDNFTLGDYTINAVFPHRITAQQGLSVSEIICNLKYLSQNISEHIVAKFGNFQLNSGFRVGSGNSQHCRGQAVDMQWPGITPQEYLRRAKWIAENLPVDQCILEKGSMHTNGYSSYWIHCSYNRNLGKQRGSLLSMIGGGNFVPGLRIS